MKKKTLLISVLVIALCVSLICGATFALFTDEVTTNVVISGGKVEIDVKIKSMTLYSLDASTQEITEQQDIFATGGTATLVGNNLTLENIVPGDGVKLLLAVENKSSVAIQYAIIVAVDNTVVNGTYKLSDVLEASIDGEPISNDIPVWNSLDAGEDFPSDTIEVAVSLPVTVGNDYQGLTCSIDIIPYAVQGNANVDNLKLAYTQEQFESALANAEAGDKIELAAGTNYELGANYQIPEGVTIEGDANTVLTVGNEDSTSGTGLAITNDNVTISNLTIVGKNIYQSSNADYAGVVRITANNVTLDGVTVESTKNNTSAIVIASTTHGGDDNVITLKNCNVKARFRALFIVDGTSGSIVLDHCNLDGVYTFNVNTNSVLQAIDLSDTTLHGWTSYSNVNHVTFTNCAFSKGTSGYDFFRPYNDTDLINCSFDSSFTFDAGKAGITLTFTNPTLPAGINSVADLIDEDAEVAFHYIVDGVANEYTPA